MLCIGILVGPSLEDSCSDLLGKKTIVAKRSCAPGPPLSNCKVPAC